MRVCSAVGEVTEAVSSPAQQIFLAQSQAAAAASIYCADAEGLDVPDHLRQLRGNCSITCGRG